MERAVIHAVERDDVLSVTSPAEPLLDIDEGCYQIVDAIHGDDYLVTDRAVDVQIVALRRKLGSHGKYIETVRGVGYRFAD